jgi:DMSO/TMAO reductase YedYZ molybdopterin-dependent catalytic subunit
LPGCDNKGVNAAADRKFQPGEPPSPENLSDDVIVSPDTLRANRIPPGQSRTRKWPVLDATGAPAIDKDFWRFRVEGLVNQPLEFSLPEFARLPRAEVFADFHCVTRWSRLGNLWEGVSTRTIVDLAGGIKQGASYVIASAYDMGWTVNMPLADFLAEDALLACAHDGEELTLEHGGPVRLIVPQLYAWKSAKWIASLKFTDQDQAGFWERNGYHMHGDPWQEERYRS